jgi:hypothetical protein
MNTSLRFQTWLAVLVGLLLNCCPISAVETNDRIYAEFDLEFKTFLALANDRIGKEVIKVERLSDRFTVPQKLTIKGTPHEIGLALGHIGQQAKARLPMLTETNRALNRKVVELYQKIYPQFLEVVRGVAEVYKEPVEQIDVGVFEADFTTRLWCDLLKIERFDPAIKRFEPPVDSGKSSEGDAKHHCSTASYYTNGHQLVGRNFDNPSDRPHYFTTLEMAGSNKVMGHTVYDISSWVVDGMNEKGLALCVTTAYKGEELYPNEPAILIGHLSQIVMQRCATVDEALALLRTVRVWFPFEVNHCLIADATGKSVVVEWNPKDYKLLVFDKSEPWELLTNTPLEEGEASLMKKCDRYRSAKPLLEAGIRNTADMLEVMKAMRITSGSTRTLWTTVMDLNARTFEVRYFKEFERKYEFKF